MQRLYCNLAEVVDDLSLAGVASEPGLLRHIRAASEWIDEQIGQFIPVTAAKTFRGYTVNTPIIPPLTVADTFAGFGFASQRIPPLLAATSITVNGVALVAGVDYFLIPLNKWWENGPYTCVRLDPAGTKMAFNSNDIIIITGLWGLYNSVLSTGQVLPGNMLIGDGTMVASDGSKFSPGMVLVIESEQLLITAGGAFTTSATTNNGALDNSQESFALVDGTKLNIGEVFKIDFEQFKAIDIQGNNVSAKRGWNHTTKVAHLTGETVYVQRTFAIDRGCNGTTAAAHAVSTPISQQFPPADVNYLAREIAALMLKKAESAFAGRSGNVNTGETFYFNELPKDPIDRILSHYRLFQI